MVFKKKIIEKNGNFLIFHIKNGNFLNFLKKKSDQTIHQNAPFKKKFGGACPQTPLAQRMIFPCAACCFATCKFPNLKKIIIAPPPGQILATPLHTNQIYFLKFLSSYRKIMPI